MSSPCLPVFSACRFTGGGRSLSGSLHWRQVDRIYCGNGDYHDKVGAGEGGTRFDRVLYSIIRAAAIGLAESACRNGLGGRRWHLVWRQITAFYLIPIDFSGGKGRRGFGGHIDCCHYGVSGLPGEPGDVAGVTGTTARYLITCGGWAMPPGCAAADCHPLASRPHWRDGRPATGHGRHGGGPPD